MSKRTIFLHDISKPTSGINKERPDEFLAIAGERELGSKPLAGLKIGSYYESQYRAPDIKHNYVDIVHEMGLDGTHAGFYHSDKSKNERFTSFSEAAQKYNETILAKSQDPQTATEYLIRNIPKRSTELTDGYINGEGYGAKPESCTILHYQQSPENPEQYVVLLHKNGKFAIADNVSKYNNGSLNLQSTQRPRFEIENVQEILNEYAVRSKCEVIYGTEDVKMQEKEESKPETVSREVDDDDGVR